MTRKILIVAEHWEGKLASISWEAIGLAETLAGKDDLSICIAIIGSEIDDLVVEIAVKTGLEVLYISHKSSQCYTPEVYCDLLMQAIQQVSPLLVIMGHSYQSMDFAPRLASMMHKPLISNCIEVHIKSDKIALVRSVYNGKLNQEILLKGDPPYLIAIQQGRFKKGELTDAGSPNVLKLNIALSDKLILKRKVLKIIRGVQGTIDLQKAEIIVAGGRGLGSKENFRIIFDLAKALRASVGASRPVVDNGWLPKDHQIGSSGQSVAPKLYIACGISGEIHHLVGIARAGCVVAINKDPHAPIFGVADYGIVGDLFQIVPAFTQSAKEMRGFSPINY
ncbi:MAG: electron transfer flavoprotein subunit alpha/FixB family protein [Syntrophobacteraceae bacterium]